MINESLVKKFAQKIDELFDWQKIIKNKVVGMAIEFADGYILSYGFGYLNETYGNLIPDQYDAAIEEALQKFIDGDYLGMLNAIPEGLDQAIDIAFFEDDFEAVFFATNFNAMVKAATYYAKKKAE
jgi:hypothetical protein